jgi:hypothetical protein
MTNAGGARIARAAFVRSGALIDVAVAAFVLAAAFAVVLTFASSTTNTSLASWLGHRILTTHALEYVLGKETFTATGAHLYQGWLGAIFAYLVGVAPRTGAVLGVAFFFCGVVLALARAHERGGTAVALVAIAALATFCGLGALSSPTITLDWLLLSVTLLLVERAEPRAAFACVGLAAVWCNIDAQGVFVPGILLLAAVGARIADRSYSARTKLFVRSGALALVATLLTPAFLELPLRAATYLQIDPTLGGLRAMQSPAARSAAQAIVVPLILAASLFGTWRRERAFDALLVVAATLFVLMNATYVPEFVLAVAPIIVPTAIRSAGIAPSNETNGLAVLLAFVAVCDVVLWGAAVNRWSSKAAVLGPAGLATALAADGKDHRIYCASIDACDAFVASENPHLRVFMDGRAAAYPRSVIDDQIAIASVRPKWRARLAAWRIDAIVVKQGRQLEQVLQLLPGTWSQTASAGSSILFVQGARP